MNETEHSYAPKEFSFQEKRHPIVKTNPGQNKCWVRSAMGKNQEGEVGGTSLTFLQCFPSAPLSPLNPKCFCVFFLSFSFFSAARFGS